MPQSASGIPIRSRGLHRDLQAGKDATGTGLGAKWEGFVITQELYEAEGKNIRFIPVVFTLEDAQHIPLELKCATHYVLSNPEAYDNLFRHLTNQPIHIKSEAVREIRRMPPLERKQRFGGPLWNVPLPRNPFFTGRKDKLEELGNALSSGGAAAREMEARAQAIRAAHAKNNPSK